MIKSKNLSRSFNGITALSNINFVVEEGEIFSYLGPNGSGKSTTVNILATLLRPSSGEISVAGYDLKREALKIRKIIGYMSEDICLYPRMSVYENLNFIGSLYRMNKTSRCSKIEELLDFFKMKDKIEAPVFTLSTGMKKKAALALALMHDPKILFLDEPTANLDPSMAREVLLLISKLKENGKTIFMTTHLLERAEKISDSVALIKKGKIIRVGKIADVIEHLRSSSLEEAYFKSMGE